MISSSRPNETKKIFVIVNCLRFVCKIINKNCFNDTLISIKRTGDYVECKQNCL